MIVVFPDHTYSIFLTIKLCRIKTHQNTSTIIKRRFFVAFDPNLQWVQIEFKQRAKVKPLLYTNLAYNTQSLQKRSVIGPDIQSYNQGHYLV